MSALRKAGVWLGLIEDEDDLYDEHEPAADRERGHDGGRERARSRPRERRHEQDEYAEDEDEEQAAPRGRGRGEEPPVARSRATERVPRRRPEGEASVRSITREPNVSYLTRDNLALAPEEAPAARPAPQAETEHRYQITTLHPTTYREGRTIGEHFREGTPVIMNLTEMDEADARRLVDFGAGLAFGLRGSMERVTNRVFLLSPANVQVTPEDKAKIAEGGFLRHS